MARCLLCTCAVVSRLRLCITAVYVPPKRCFKYPTHRRAGLLNRGLFFDFSCREGAVRDGRRLLSLTIPSPPSSTYTQDPHGIRARKERSKRQLGFESSPPDCPTAIRHHPTRPGRLLAILCPSARMTAAAAERRRRLLVPIEVFSDTLCPWCYVEKHSLEAALRRYEARYPDVGFEVVWRSFCLNPLLKTST